MEEKEKDFRIQIWVKMAAEEIFFGPGTCQLMEKIEETGSIREACILMKLSYSKGCKMIKRMERELGYPVVDRKTGGAGGGGSSLTEKGKHLLHSYKMMVNEIKQSADEIYRKYF